MKHEINLTEKDFRKLFKYMLYLNEFGFEQSVIAIYKDLLNKGFEFYIWNREPKQINKYDNTYMWIEVEFKLLVISKNNGLQINKALQSWRIDYVMTRKDIDYNDWIEENIDVNDNTCSIYGVLETLQIYPVDRPIEYFQKIVFG